MSSENATSRQVERNLARKLSASESSMERQQGRALMSKVRKEQGWPGELMYVYGLTHDKPIAHRLDDKSIDNGSWVKTSCGERLSFTIKNALMPRKHAECFSELCSECHY